MPRHFVRVNDDLLLIEIIRRLRHERISNVDYIAYPGVVFAEVLNSAQQLGLTEKIRELLSGLTYDGAICCTGSLTAYTHGTYQTDSGLVTCWHPDIPVRPGQWFTPAGTPLDERRGNALRSRGQPCVRVRNKHIYVVADGLPKKVMAERERARIVFSRDTFPLERT